MLKSNSTTVLITIPDKANIIDFIFILYLIKQTLIKNIDIKTINCIKYPRLPPERSAIICITTLVTINIFNFLEIFLLEVNIIIEIATENVETNPI